MNIAQKYIKDVIAGKTIVGKYVKAVVKRHQDELKAQKKKDFPYWFDEDAAEHPLTVFKHFKFSKGIWSAAPFDLMPWQAFVLWCAYGWKFKGSNRRRFNKIYIKVARKNGKTEYLAGIGQYGQFFDESDRDVEIYWFATKKDQARIGFERQKEMTKLLMAESAYFASIAGISKHRVYSKSDLSFTAYLGKDSKSEDGTMPFYGICDEYHAHPTDEMTHVIESGMVSRQNPMMWQITTAGFNPNSPCARMEAMAKKVLDGVMENDQLFAVMFDLDDDDDPDDERNWIKANPGLGVSVSLDNLRDAYKRAKAEGITSWNNFLTKNLNKWVKAEKTWIKDKEWMSGVEEIDRSALLNRTCYGGLDLASTNDLCALVLDFPPEEENDKHIVLCWFWCPEDNATSREKNDGIPYLQWAHDGYLTLTPGNVVDERYIIETVMQICRTYEVHSIGYDPYNSTAVARELSEDGIKMDVFRQGFISMSEPTKQLEKTVLKGKYNHLGNPVLRWMASNVSIRQDPAGNIKIDKAKSSEKVDGMVAGVMALGQWMTYKSDYNGSPLTVISIND